jgi:SOS-response transcriptional repressor LexA
LRLIDGNYATVKKFYREPDIIRLEPANPQFKPILTRLPERIQIQGVVRAHSQVCRLRG